MALLSIFAMRRTLSRRRQGERMCAITFQRISVAMTDDAIKARGVFNRLLVVRRTVKTGATPWSRAELGVLGRLPADSSSSRIPI